MKVRNNYLGGLPIMPKTKKITIKIDQEQGMFATWVNTDLTEGRGSNYPAFICSSKTTARRLGKGRDVQGCDAGVTPCRAFLIDGRWYAPVTIHGPNHQDEETDALEAKKSAAEVKAKALGLTPDEIEDLCADLSIKT